MAVIYQNRLKLLLIFDENNTMTLIEYIRTNHIKPADAIILNKKFLGMVDHYAVFLGFRGNQTIFVANYRDGVREVDRNEMVRVLEFLRPARIDRFPGNELERRIAVNRAISRIGERAYDYLTNNCEHFKNWVHFGERYSRQVKIAGDVSLGLGAGFLIGSIATKNPKLCAFAFLILFAGLLIQDYSEA